MFYDLLKKWFSLKPTTIPAQPVAPYKVEVPAPKESDILPPAEVKKPRKPRVAKPAAVVVPEVVKKPRKPRAKKVSD